MKPEIPVEWQYITTCNVEKGGPVVRFRLSRKSIVPFVPRKGMLIEIEDGLSGEVTDKSWSLQKEQFDVDLEVNEWCGPEHIAWLLCGRDFSGFKLAELEAEFARIQELAAGNGPIAGLAKQILVERQRIVETGELPEAPKT
jgi:hypothetical protein